MTKAIPVRHYRKLSLHAKNYVLHAIAHQQLSIKRAAKNIGANYSSVKSFIYAYRKGTLKDFQMYQGQLSETQEQKSRCVAVQASVSSRTSGYNLQFRSSIGMKVQFEGQLWNGAKQIKSTKEEQLLNEQLSVDFGLQAIACFL